MMEEDRGYWYPALQIAAGILIATAVIGTVGYAYTSYQVRLAERALAQTAEDVAAKNRAALQQRQAAERARLAAENARREAERQRAAEVDRARREGIAQMEAKQRAWLRYYQQPAECEKPPTWDVQVECGNRYIRARKDFETKWGRGELR